MKYLFEVEYLDGSKFKQNQEDKSEKDPKRSAYYDVLHSGKVIKKFTLGKLFDKWSVDLTTGEFTHNGYKFQLEWNIKPAKRELFFIRQNEIDATATYNTKNRKMIDVTQGAFRTIFFIGYKVGKKEYIIGIK